MKRTLLLLLILSYGLISKASHIIGGEMSHKYISSTTTTVTYQVTLKLYRVCDEAANLAELPNSVYFAVFSNSDNSQLSGSPFLISQTSKQTIQSGQADPCIVNPPEICFQIGTYVGTVTVPISTAGYTVSFQTCCRDYTMSNIVDTHQANDETNYPGNGATYFTELPGTTNNFITNSSPVFNKDEAILVCANKKFTYDFSATDPDGDSIVYVFCAAYGGGKVTNGGDKYATPPAAVAPPYSSVPYKSPYTGTTPLGDDAYIVSNSGLITGIAPDPGKYVVTVCAYEYRDGQLLGIHRKDFHMIVTTCVREVEAAMPDKYDDCSGYTITFLNYSTEGKTYDWDFGDGTTYTTTSTDPIPHTYAAEGVYNVKLWVDSTSNCGDSATAVVYVYPKLTPDMSIAGLCSNTTTTFTNTSATTSATDAIATYRWDFGDTSTSADTSWSSVATYKYPGPGTYTVILDVTTTNGCVRSDTSTIVVYDNPPITTTPDTLLCIRNSLQLSAESVVDGQVVNGTYTWTPDYNITNANTATPTVSPKIDTAYTVTFTDGTGCTNTATVNIDVRDTLIVRTIADSTVCTGDTLHIRSFADGDYPLTWYDISTNTQVGDSSILVIVPPSPDVTYAVVASLGDCSGYDTVSLKVVDPPVAYAGVDTTICYGDQVTLTASGGAYYQWTPTFSLTAPDQSTTVAKPTDTTQYIVTVTDTKGCPKPVTDTVQINVVPQVHAFAGNDTIAILNQPFTLHATGGTTYVWTPTDGLDNPNIDTPTTTINHDITYTVTAYTAEGCSGTDAINLRFIVGPDIYVPTGFSPNGDGQNDIFRPLPVGITQMEFFRVFDRWGKLMYSTTEYLQGWDGNYDGKPAAIGTYVWVVQGKNVNSETVIRKGTVTLIR
ncbi:PKD domain-containing protein [Chitinophaga sancti]|uniref:PKD domain-containing protein n=1 Tax=Chitinophaga sancti TaxID=1004 RepID=UPI002A75D5E9|nr:PKD domain-containing protein [Chitinophaga sancti]WPQ62901.1 PKD domain-containing protein [Chitinophaga sancti]